MKQITELLFYKFFFPSVLWFSNFLPKKISLKILKWLLEQNNKIVLTCNNKGVKNILILLPRCVQYFNCKFNLISSVENCRQCGKCKIKDILELKNKYKINNIKVASGGKLAKLFVEEVQPDIIIAVACEFELIAGIKDVYPIKTLAIPNIIVKKPCMNTDVEVNKIEDFIQLFC